MARHCRLQRCAVDDAIDEADPLRLVRIEPLAQEVDFERLAQSDDARQRPRAAAVGRQSDLPVRGRKICVIRGNGKIARRCERQPEAGHGAAQRADHHLRHPLHVFDRRMQAVDDELEIGLPLRGFGVETRCKRLQVAARHEVLARTLQHDHAQRRVGGDRGHVGDERIHHRQIECVQRRLTVERQVRHRAVARQQHRFRIRVRR